MTTRTPRLERLESRALFSAIPGDADLSGTVDVLDYTALAAHFNQRPATWQNGDFNADGGVDLTDFTILAAHFGQTAAHDFTVAAGQPLPAVSPGQSVLMTGKWPRVAFPWSGTAAAPIRVDFAPGSTVGDGQTGTVVSGGTYLRIGGLEVLNVRQSQLQAAGAAVKIGTGTTLADSHIHDVEACGLAIFGAGARVLDSTIDHAGQLGFTTQFASDVLIDGVRVLYCNNGLADPSWKGFTAAGYQVVYNIGGRYFVNPDWEAGADKLWSSDRVTVSNSEFAYNVGPGLWTDYHNTNVTFIGNHVHDNRGLTDAKGYQGEAIRLELSPAAGGFDVRDNLLDNNTGAGLTLTSVRDVTIQGNTFTGNGVAGILLRNDDGRGALTNIASTGDTFVGNPVYAVWGSRFPLTNVVIEGVRL